MSYLNTVASKFGVLSKIQFNTTVVRSVWDEGTKLWTVETGSGQIFKGDMESLFQLLLRTPLTKFLDKTTKHPYLI